MKRTLLSTAILAVGIAVAIPVAAQQFGPGQGRGGMHGAHWGGGPGMGRMCEEGEARAAGMLAYAEKRLNITDAQRAAWTKLADQVRTSAAEMQKTCLANRPQPPQPGQGPQQTTLPDRLGHMETMMTAGLESIKRVKPALDDLYAQLTPEQKKLADEFVNRGMRGMQGGPGKPGGPGMPGGPGAPRQPG
ncbi:Spy/CpxP family protein refolding chaperone [Azospirillum sp. RWY-5-1]|uniref:Spy/CpxP family protein refolding chaperone n=1 Tax=Azospirillum oleiclasticum TaxID=2735135 RepID=A0ABX2T8T3_9PROT|nr:Spy/CpxP family protein refolding chaperone [Azospirillum oleiclasticum]NYZ13326.1 Spy/CpxP family protein refolding chaperone [Azospirillum oleiclasticum]NYZ20487.1 Spy/CpxP family protein refolding chaperone [Azospirillum oleiclasticum]